MNVLLPTLGSAGDVNPFVALGVALQSRGHRATVLTNPLFQEQIEAQGLGFLPVGTLAEAQRTVADPDLWHVRKGFGIIARLLVPAAEQVFRLIERHADGQTVVAFSTLSLGARLAQEKLGVPSASVHLQPSVFRTLNDQGMFGNVRLSAAHPRWLKRTMFRLADALILDANLRGPLNEFRGRLGLAPIDRIMHRWLHSPQLVIAFFPSWFAAPQPDWPENVHLVGFPLWDEVERPPRQEAERRPRQEPERRPRQEPERTPRAQADGASLDEAMQFLRQGAPPVVFTPGSAGSTMHEFFAQSVAAARQSGVRAMLITNHPQQLPARLPAGIKAFGYVPFSRVLPHAALLAYHGGIGTLAQAVRAAVPHLVVPHAYDQFDSAFRIERLGLGKSLTVRAYRAPRVAHAIAALIGSTPIARRCSELASQVDGSLAVTKAVDLLEGLRQSP